MVWGVFYNNMIRPLSVHETKELARKEVDRFLRRGGKVIEIRKIANPNPKPFVTDYSVK